MNKGALCRWIQFSRPQTSSISCSALAGLSVSPFAVSNSVPSRGVLGASLLPSSVKASNICSWFFCRLALIESRVLLILLTVWAFIAFATTTPAADCRGTVRMDCSLLSHGSVTCSGSPEVSSTTFHAQPPDLPPVCLMDLGFAVSGPLARHRRPQIRFLSIGSRVCSALPSDLASRLGPCASLTLHLHRVG